MKPSSFSFFRQEEGGKRPSGDEAPRESHIIKLICLFFNFQDPSDSFVVESYNKNKNSTL